MLKDWIAGLVEVVLAAMKVPRSAFKAPCYFTFGVHIAYVTATSLLQVRSKP